MVSTGFISDDGISVPASDTPTREHTSAPKPLALTLRLGQLIAGLLGFGAAVALFIRSGLGLGPWDAFHYGLHVQTGMTVGTASILAGAVILVITSAMRLVPGIGTILNMVLIGVFLDLLLIVIPPGPNVVVSAAYLGAAILLIGLASGMYIGAGFGHGPRDGLMVALTLRTGWPVRRIRTAIEATALALGWLMGGTVGIGTAVILLTIGPSVQWGLKLFGALPDQELERHPARFGGSLSRSAEAALARAHGVD